MSVVLSEHLPLLAGAPDGVQKLRGLILELAVRGKLVPQDPKDEPASELLTQIAKERARLEVDGTSKKSKAVPPVGENEQPFALPDNWEWVRLGTVSRNVQYGYTASADHASRDVLFVRITDIQDNRVNWDAVPGCQIPVADVSAYQLQRGDILIARTGGTIGKSYLVEGLDRPAIFASYLIRVGYLCGTDATFTKVFLGSECYWSQLYANSMGTGQPNVNGTALSGLTFPLPPLAEQRRIVAKVDELMALCDRLETEQTDATSAHAKLVETLLGTLTQSRDAFELAANWQRLSQHFDTLFSTEVSLDALKQTILQLAVMGKLVPQDSNDEPASELLKRVAAEKMLLVAEGKLKKGNLLTSIDEDDKPFYLPLGWTWTQLGSIAMFENGDRSSRYPNESDHQTSGVPFFGAKDMVDGVLRFDNGLRFISEAKFSELSNGKLIDGDFVILLRGTVGKIAVFRSISKFPTGFINAQMLIVRILDKGICNFFETYSATSFFQTLVTNKTTGSAVRQMPSNVMFDFLIPLPPLAEQHRIVAKVDELMALCDGLKSDLAEARARQARLSTTLVNAALKAA